MASPLSHLCARRHRYTDTTGNPTVCYGYNLNADQGQLAASGCTATASGGCCTQSQCQTLLQGAVTAAEAEEQAVFGGPICPCIDAVLTDMVRRVGQHPPGTLFGVDCRIPLL